MKYNLKNLELKTFFRSEDYISGEEMLKRALEFKALGSKHFAEWLEKNQNQIPKEWRQYYIIFPEYIELDDDRGRIVAYFYWNVKSQRWVLYFYWVGSYFFSRFTRDGRFVVPREFLETGNFETSLKDL